MEYNLITPEIKDFFDPYCSYYPSYFPDCQIDDHKIANLTILSKFEQNNILSFITNLFEKYGFKCKTREEYTEYEFLIEFHRYHLSGTKVVESKLCRHIDDKAGCIAKVNTFIYYVKKSESIIGGDLLLYPEDTKENKIHIKTGTFLLMRGDIEHEVTPLTGKGERKCIIVQIPRID